MKKEFQVTLIKLLLSHIFVFHTCSYYCFLFLVKEIFSLCPHLTSRSFFRDRLCGLVVRVSGYRYRGPAFDPRRYQIFWVVVGLERGPLSLVSLVRSIEELLEWKCSGSRSRKQRLTAVGTRCADHVTPLYPQTLALTSPTGGGRSIGIVRVRTKATEFSLDVN